MQGCGGLGGGYNRKMHKILILAEHEKQYQALIEKAQLPNLQITGLLANDVDIALGEPSRIKAALAYLPALKWVQSIWAGVEPLLDPALRRDYVLTNARGVFGGLMTEHVFGYLLAHERKIFAYRESQGNKIWRESEPGSLRGKTIGLLGVGSIGADLARAAKFFGMKVRGYTKASEDCTQVDDYFHGQNLIPFAQGLDYLVSILPNTKDTRKIVNADVLNTLPTHAVFINVGRGAAVDESALLDALNQKKIAGAVLDVFEQEPLPKEHPFWATPNLLMTYHTSALSHPEDIVKVFFENYELFNAGKPLKYQVDFEKGY